MHATDKTHAGCALLLSSDTCDVAQPGFSLPCRTPTMLSRGTGRVTASNSVVGLLLACLALLLPAAAACRDSPPLLPESRLHAAGRTLQGVDTVLPVQRSEGFVLPANSSEDGGGCIVFVDHVPTGIILATTTQPTVGDCCRACRQTADCNVYAYCPQQGGCTTPRSYNVSTVAYQGCVLLSQGLSAPPTGRPAVALNSTGMLGGAPVLAAAAPLPGYSLHIGQGFFGRFDYPCNGSLTEGACLLPGTPEELAPRCNADPACRVMVYLPSGRDYLGPNLTDLKGGWGSNVSASDTTFNQNGAAYIKLEPPPWDTSNATASSGGGSSLSGGAIAGIVIGSVAGALAAAAAGWALWRRRQKQEVQQSPRAGRAAGKAPLHLATAKTGSSDLKEFKSGSGTGSSGDFGRRDSAGLSPQAAAAAAAAGGQPVSGSCGPFGLALSSAEAWAAAQHDGARAYTSGPAPTGRLFQASALFLHSQRPGLEGPARLPSLTLEASSLGTGASTEPGSSAAAVAAAVAAATGRAAAGAGWHSGGTGGGQSPAGAGSLDSTPPASTVRPVRLSQGRTSWELSAEGLIGHHTPPVAGVSGGSSTGRQPSSSEENTSTGTPHSQPTVAQLLSRLPEVRWTDWLVEFETIEFLRQPEGGYQELGSGGYGTVYRVMLDGVQPHAAKVLDLGQTEEAQNTFLREASVMRRLRHRNIVGFRGVCINEGRGILLMELMEGGDLFSKIPLLSRHTHERAFGWYARGKKVLLDVARGIHYLHSLHLTHFDIKSSNVLLSRDLTAKVADVGFTRLVSNSHYEVDGRRAGTFQYMAPELLLGRPCSNAVDIYSFGVLCWEVCSGEHPQRGRNRPLRCPEDCPEEVAQLYLDCIEEDPAARPTARQVVERLTAIIQAFGSGAISPAASAPAGRISLDLDRQHAHNSG